MGWLQLHRHQTDPSVLNTSALQKDCTSTHVGTNQNDTSLPLSYPFIASHVPDDQLPFIPTTSVLHVTSNGHRRWLIIDDTIYDCTDFISEHPGGKVVIDSFVGKDCSWQFWRFHTREHMEIYGNGLRVGRTKGVENPYKEPARYVGLRGLGTKDEGLD
jgi:cytochrome b involved in lipid metabolism